MRPCHKVSSFVALSWGFFCPSVRSVSLFLTLATCRARLAFGIPAAYPPPRCAWRGFFLRAAASTGSRGEGRKRAGPLPPSLQTPNWFVFFWGREGRGGGALPLRGPFCLFFFLKLVVVLVANIKLCWLGFCCFLPFHVPRDQLGFTIPGRDRQKAPYRDTCRSFPVLGSVPFGEPVRCAGLFGLFSSLVDTLFHIRTRFCGWHF